MVLQSFLESLNHFEIGCPTGPEDWIFLLVRKALISSKAVGSE